MTAIVYSLEALLGLYIILQQACVPLIFSPINGI